MQGAYVRNGSRSKRMKESRGGQGEGRKRGGGRTTRNRRMDDREEKTTHGEEREKDRSYVREN